MRDLTGENSRVASGRSAEDLAADYLDGEGFHVLWKNVRIGALEIDLVAQREDLVIIVEVRMRGSGAFDQPLSSITYRKRQLLVRASRGLWRGRLKKMPDVKRVRIDVIGIVTSESETPRIEWIRGAICEE